MTSIADAVVAAARALLPGRQVWDGQVLQDSALADYDTLDRRGYVVAYCPEGDVQLTNVGGAVDGKSVVAMFHSFGPTRTSARWLSSRLTDGLIATGVNAAEWGHADVTEHFNRPPVADNDVPEYPVVRIYDEFRFLFAKL